MTARCLESTSRRHMPTASITAPPTQNTAPVIEHRCLYTYDLKRKAKRWQDGILRFHTFNKRVMVYDVPRNYIGDTHWRDSNPVQDGDELELDRPVLVQVADQIGSVEQDLTEILEKRGRNKPAPRPEASDNGSSPPALSTNHSETNFAPRLSPLQPKSLNALLGKPRGKLGRASLPMKSPYELRARDPMVIDTFHHPPKRQRIDSCTDIRIARPVGQDLEQSGEQSSPVEPRSRPEQDLLRMQKHQPSKSNDNRRSLTSQVPAEDLGREDNPRRRDTSRMNQVQPPKKRQMKHSERIDSVKPSDACSVTKKTAQAPLIVHKDIAANAAGCQAEINPQYDTAPDHDNDKARPRSRLQIAVKKPRRKLMYRDLLAEGAAARPQIPLPKESESESHRSGDATDIRAHSADSSVAVLESGANHSTSLPTKDRPKLPTSQSGSISNSSNAKMRNATKKTATDPRSIGSATSIPHASNQTFEQPNQLLSGHAAEPQNENPLVREDPTSPTQGNSQICPTEMPEARLQQLRAGELNKGKDVFEDEFACSFPLPGSLLEAQEQTSDSRELPLVLDESHPASTESRRRGSTQRNPPSLRSSHSAPINPNAPSLRAKRSPLRPSLSEASMSTGTRKPKKLGAAATAPDKAVQVTEPWSMEAWDLFGCTADGIGVPYNEFRHKSVTN